MNRRFLFPIFLLVLIVALFLIIPRIIVRTEDAVFDLQDEDSAEEVEELYVLPLKEELNGKYVLTGLSSEELQLTESEFASLRKHGIPIELTIESGGRAILAIFDTRTELQVDPDAMLLQGGGQIFPFYYQNGRLIVWDAGSRTIFEKVT